MKITSNEAMCGAIRFRVGFSLPRCGPGPEARNPGNLDGPRRPSLPETRRGARSSDDGGGPVHGIIHAELKRYVVDRHGAESWPRLLAACGVAPTPYLAHRVYPDEELTSVVEAASRIAGRPAA